MLAAALALVLAAAPTRAEARSAALAWLDAAGHKDAAQLAAASTLPYEQEGFTSPAGKQLPCPARAQTPDELAAAMSCVATDLAVDFVSQRLQVRAEEHKPPGAWSEREVPSAPASSRVVQLDIKTGDRFTFTFTVSATPKGAKVSRVKLAALWLE